MIQILKFLLSGLMCLMLFNCVAEPEELSVSQDEEAMYLDEHVYEYISSFNLSTQSWESAIILTVQDKQNYIRGYFGSDSSYNTKNIMVKGQYHIRNDSIYFHDQQRMDLINGECQPWQTLNTSPITYAIQNIDSAYFEMWGKWELWDAPADVQEISLEGEKFWVEIDGFNSPDQYPEEIDKCEKMSLPGLQ